ncbi:MAG: hypothetical protein ABJ314_06930 [Ilumatobacter sp.]
MPSEGSPGATPPTSPEPALPWQPDYSGDASATVAGVPPTPTYGQPPYSNVPSAGPAGQYPPQGVPQYAAGDPSGSTPPGTYSPAGAQPQFLPVGGPPSGGGKGSGKGKLIGLGLGVVGLLAIGFLALRFLLGGDATGGASSPEAVVDEMVAAINAQDPLAVVDLMAPDELDGVDQLVEDGSRYIEDLGLDTLLDENQDDGSAIDVAIDITADRIDVSMEGDRAAIVSFQVSGDVETSGNDAMNDAFGDEDISFDSRDLDDSFPTDSGDIEIIVIELDGQWYMSPMLTIGHYIVQAADLPPGEYDQIGGDRDPGAESPVDAVQALVDVINDPDADALAAALGGGEGRVALAFRDAIDDGFAEIDTGDISYELTVDAEDIGSGRVELQQVELQVTGDPDDSATVTIEGDCLRVRDNGETVTDECLLDLLDLPTATDLDTTLWLDTVDEDGGRRVRLVPTVTDVLGRFLTVIDDRQTLLFVTDSAQRDDATVVEPGSDIEIDFDGQLYAVNEFPIEEGEVYNVTASEDADIAIFADGEFGSLQPQFGSEFEAEVDGVARVVTYSEIDVDEDCGLLPCLPSGEGSTTLRIRQAGRQALPFPTRITGDFGPGDVRIFELEVEAQQQIRIDVTGEGIEWRIRDDFDLLVDTDTYDFPPGTYELIVVNTSGDDDTSYQISPTPA